MKLQKEEIQNLTIKEKSKLVSDILEMMDDEVLFTDDTALISKEELELLDERIKRVKENPDASRPWEEVKKDLSNI